jgi:hypothetical protein
MASQKASLQKLRRGPRGYQSSLMFLVVVVGKQTLARSSSKVPAQEDESLDLEARSFPHTQLSRWYSTRLVDSRKQGRVRRPSLTTLRILFQVCSLAFDSPSPNGKFKALKKMYNVGYEFRICSPVVCIPQ